jgi:hypothetical protein
MIVLPLAWVSVVPRESTARRKAADHQSGSMWKTPVVIMTRGSAARREAAEHQNIDVYLLLIMPQHTNLLLLLNW